MSRYSDTVSDRSAWARSIRMRSAKLCLADRALHPAQNRALGICNLFILQRPTADHPVFNPLVHLICWLQRPAQGKERYTAMAMATRMPTST